MRGGGAAATGDAPRARAQGSGEGALVEGREKKKHLCVIAIACAMATHLLTTNAVK